MTTFRRLLPGAVVLLAIVPAACDIKVSDRGINLDVAEGRASDEWSRTYTLPKGGRLEIVSIDGSIEAFPAAGSQVEVKVTREVRSRSDEAAKEILQKLVMKEDVSPERVLVESPDVRGLGGFMQGVRIEYRVNVPPGLDVSLKTRNGAVRLENVDGRITAASTNGEIAGRGLSGSVDASTVNGGITMNLVAVTDDVRIETVNGGIRLNVGPTVGAHLEASAVNGGVVVQEGLPLQATERSRLRVAGPINEGGPKIAVHTTNGRIRIGAVSAP